MKTLELTEKELVIITKLVSQRKEEFEKLLSSIEMNDAFGENIAIETLQRIFEINKQIKLEEDKLISENVNYIEFVNRLKFQTSAVMNFNKDEVKNSMI